MYNTSEKSYESGVHVLDAVFTKKALMVLRLAKAEAKSMGHTNLSQAHVLIAITKLSNDLTVEVLKNLSVSERKVRVQIAKLLPPLNPITEEDGLYTQDVEIIQQGAITEAKGLRSAQVDVVHLFLGAIQHKSSTASRIFFNLDINPADVRAEVIRMVTTSEQANQPKQRDQKGGQRKKPS